MSFPYLDAALFLMGITRDDVEAANAATDNTDRPLLSVASAAE